MSVAPRVLVSGVVLGQPMGGVRRHNAELLPRLAERLRAAGGGLGVLEGAVPIPFELPDVVERIPSDVPYQPPHMRALAESRALREALAAAAAAGRAFDLVHTAHLPAPRDLGVPVTRTVHDLRSIDLERAPFVRRLIGGRVLRRALEGARAVGVVSDWMASRVLEEWPALEGRVHVIGNGADHLPILPREPADPGFALHVGHVEPRKGLEALVRSLGHARGPERVVLAGRAVARELDRLRGIAFELGVADRLEHVTPGDDEALARLLATARVAVFPSRLEGCGIGPLEALRAGCPTAVSDIPAHREVAGPGAERFQVGDVDELVDAMDRALAAPSPALEPRTWDSAADAWFEMLAAAARGSS